MSSFIVKRRIPTMRTATTLQYILRHGITVNHKTISLRQLSSLSYSPLYEASIISTTNISTLPSPSNLHLAVVPVAAAPPQPNSHRFFSTDKPSDNEPTIEFKLETEEEEEKASNETKKGEEVEVDRSKFTQLSKIKLPDFKVEEGGGRVIKWYKKEGDLLHYKDMLCDIELEEFSFGMSYDDEDVGIMGEILVPVDHPEAVAPGTVLCETWNEDD